MGSERVSEKAFEKPLKTSENLSNGSENLSKPLKTSENLPSQRPSQRQISLSEPLRQLLPPIVLPLETPTRFGPSQNAPAKLPALNLSVANRKL